MSNGMPPTAAAAAPGPKLLAFISVPPLRRSVSGLKFVVRLRVDASMMLGAVDTTPIVRITNAYRKGPMPGRHPDKQQEREIALLHTRSTSELLISRSLQDKRDKKT